MQTINLSVGMPILIFTPLGHRAPWTKETRGLEECRIYVPYKVVLLSTAFSYHLLFRISKVTVECISNTKQTLYKNYMTIFFGGNEVYLLVHVLG